MPRTEEASCRDIAWSFTRRPSGPEGDSSLFITCCRRRLTSTIREYSSSSRSAFPIVPSPASMRERIFLRCVVESDASDSRPLNGSSATPDSRPPSSIGTPLLEGVMSTAFSPRSPSAPSVTVLWVVIRDITRRSSRMSTSTMPLPSGAKSTLVTVPFSTPPSRTGAPALRPLTSDIRAFT